MWLRRLTDRKFHSLPSDESKAEPICLGPVEVLRLIQHFGVPTGPDRERNLLRFANLEAAPGCEPGFRI